MTNCNTSENKVEESSMALCGSPTDYEVHEGSAAARDPAWRSRVLYCRKCDGHGKQVALKGHAPKCPYNLCQCQSCSKLMTRRLHSFKKRNKSRLEAAAILTAQKKAQMAALELRRLSVELPSHFDVGDKFCNMPNIPQATTFSSSTEDHPVKQVLQKDQLNFGMKAGTKPITVMSYEIWKEQCAARKNSAFQTKTHLEQQPRKRSLDQPNGKETPISKRSSRSLPVLSRSHSSANVDWSLITSNSSKNENENRLGDDEYRRVTLPTIPPMTVLVRRDGSPVASSVAPLQPTITPEKFSFTTSQNQTPSEPSSTSNPVIRASATPILRNPIAVNHVPSCDVRLSTTNSDEGAGSGLSTATCPSMAVFSGIIHRPSPSLPNSHNLLKLPLDLVTSHSAVASHPSPIASTIVTQSDPLETLSFQITQASGLRNGLSEALQNETLAGLLPSALPTQDNAAVLVQQQQQQQAVQQIFANATVGSLIGAASMQPATALVNPVLARTPCANLIPALAASGTLPVSNTGEQAANLLHNLQQQHQLQQPISSSNLLASSDLLHVYQTLLDPLTSQTLQTQLKQLEHPGLLLGQSIAT